MTKIISFSGGKDSTAMCILLKKGYIDADVIRMCTLGDWDWGEMEAHVKQVEEYLDMDIERIDLSDVIQRDFKKYGFAHFRLRWCTGLKTQALNWLTTKSDLTYIGITVDEYKRTLKHHYKSQVRFPLVEYNYTGEDALKLCTAEGFRFGGIYEHHEHFNCWCCPLQKVGEIEWLWLNRPDLWQKLLEMQDGTDRWFHNGHTVHDFDYRFENGLRGWKWLDR